MIDVRTSNKRLAVAGISRPEPPIVSACLSDQIAPHLLEAGRSWDRPGIGRGVAIPHAGCPISQRPYGLLAKLKAADRIRRHRRASGGHRVSFFCCRLLWRADSSSALALVAQGVKTAGESGSIA